MPDEVVNPAQSPMAPPPESHTATGQNRIKIVPYPKVVFFYPTYFFSLFCGLLSINGEIPILGLIFLTVFMFNLFVISFEFSRIKFIATTMAFVMLILSMLLADQYNIHVFSWLKTIIQNLDLRANHVFYFAISVVFTLIYTIVYFSTKWNYWIIEPNEILHYHGFMGDVHRFPAPHLKMSKEITDIFEYFLLFAGTLILSPTSESRDIVLENVLFINRKEEKIKNLLSSISVKIRK